MKKIIPIIFFAITTNAFAEVIHCPSQNNYADYGKQWEISIEKNVCAINPATRDYFCRVFSKKIEDKIINIDITHNKVTQSTKGIVLECSGLFSSSGEEFYNNGKKDRLKAELRIDINDYKKCTVLDNKSFECK